MKRGIFSARIFNSLVRSEDTTKSEKAFGYFLGPCLVYTMYNGVAGTYLTQFYTDILGLAGTLLIWMPLVSKLFSAAAGLIIGRMIDKTRTTQGKARPWILASGILLAVCGTLLYLVPNASQEIKIAWVVVSYNLFFSLAFSVYSLSHSLMVPLSTRDVKQRDSLAMLTSTAISMIPGMLSTVIMPFLVREIGVGAAAQGSWITIMAIFSIIAIPATLIEYYFTKERVTEEKSIDAEKVSFGRQIKACFADKYWVLVILFTLITTLCSGLSTSSMLYYCNWVLGNSVESGAVKQLLVNMIGQMPMGFGIFILWPLVRKFGKRKISIIGFSLAAAASIFLILAGNNLPFVLAALFIRSIGALPTYVSASLLADALDHLERKHDIRADGFSASVNSIIQTLAMGTSQTLLLAGIDKLGYISPQSASQVIEQPESIKLFFIACFAAMPLLGYLLNTVIMALFDLEKESSAVLPKQVETL